MPTHLELLSYVFKQDFTLFNNCSISFILPLVSSESSFTSSLVSASTLFIQCFSKTVYPFDFCTMSLMNDFCSSVNILLCRCSHFNTKFLFFQIKLAGFQRLVACQSFFFL